MDAINNMTAEILNSAVDQATSWVLETVLSSLKGYIYITKQPIEKCNQPLYMVFVHFNFTVKNIKSHASTL